MKVLYINILLFALPLNILVGYPKNTYTTRYTPTNTSRLLCEGDMYTSMYDNDPEMKAVMENYNRQTSDRFKEYDEKMQDKRQKCKEQCDKAIQKIVLKDKLEKELTQKFSTLETNIDTNDMPTCVCKKSLADKTEKFCLNCGLGIGSGVLQASGLLGGIGAVAVNAWKPKALESAITAALKAGASNISAAAKAAGNAQGMKVVIYFLEQLDIDKLVPGICEQISRTGNYANITNFINTIIEQRGAMCGLTQELGGDMCKKIGINLGTIGQNGGHGLPDAIAIPAKVKLILDKATLTAKGKAAEVTTSKTLAIKAAQEKAIEAASTHLYTTIAYSITAVLIIVLIMVIIYLILRYRRKKKKEKKLQYIKLLEE